MLKPEEKKALICSILSMQQGCDIPQHLFAEYNQKLVNDIGITDEQWQNSYADESTLGFIDKEDVPYCQEKIAKFKKFAYENSTDPSHLEVPIIDGLYLQICERWYMNGKIDKK